MSKNQNLIDALKTLQASYELIGTIIDEWQNRVYCIQCSNDLSLKPAGTVNHNGKDVTLPPDFLIPTCDDCGGWIDAYDTVRIEQFLGGSDE